MTYTYHYPRPAVTVDAILISPNKSVLLIERGREPFKGQWALPGGFIITVKTTSFGGGHV